VRELNRNRRNVAGIEYLQPHHKLGKTIALARLIISIVSDRGVIKDVVLRKDRFFCEVWEFHVDTLLHKAETAEWASPWRSGQMERQESCERR
jgi:hypothetical protein